MRLRLRVVIILGVLICLASGTSILSAMTIQKENDGEVKTEKSQNLEQFLNLSEEQIAALGQEMRLLEQKYGPLLLKCRQLDERIWQASRTGDATGAGNLSPERRSIEKQIGEARSAYRERVKEILTPQQQVELARIAETVRLVEGSGELLNLLGVSTERPEGEEPDGPSSPAEKSCHEKRFDAPGPR